MNITGGGGGWRIYYAERYQKLITIGRSNLFSSMELMNKMVGEGWRGSIYYAQRYINKKEGGRWTINYAARYKKLITINRSNLSSSIEYMSKMGEGGIYNAERYTKLITIGRTNLFSNIEYMKKKEGFIMLIGIQIKWFGRGVEHSLC